MTEIRVELSPAYPVFVEPIDAARLLTLCQNLAKQWVLITDSTVATLHAQTVKNILSELNLCLLEFPAGEAHKTRETKAALEDKMLARGFNRDTGIIALGGGVVSDLAGFIAATYCRGIPMIFIPTTLLAMVDASIGGKTAVNTAYGKNLIGCFYQPRAVFVDVNFLETLPAAELEYGLVEMLKHALIDDRAQFEQLKAHYQPTTHWLLRDKSWLVAAITQSILIKKHVVEQDEKDRGMRQWLNFGHTLGHVIEQLSDYQVPHGQAVAIGILLESHLSLQVGLLSEKEFHEVVESLQMFHFSLKTDCLKRLDDVLHCLYLDKKANAQAIYCVLLEKIGAACSQYTYLLSKENIRKTLNWYHQVFKEAKPC